mmetsp:Transcript_7527/g.15033  ORF Transcript_7527/g.15033 Transcript_7527/m.15033 type:complete len:510 (+) Transcript_7527:74-1603(+)
MPTKTTTSLTGMSSPSRRRWKFLPLVALSCVVLSMIGTTGKFGGSSSSSSSAFVGLACASEASVDEYGKVVLTDDRHNDNDNDDNNDDVPIGKKKPFPEDDSASLPPPRPDEQLSISISNASPFRVDIYWDDGQYGTHLSTLSPGESTLLNTFLRHSFFVTRHGVKEALFADDARLLFSVSQRDQRFVVPPDAAPSSDPCRDRFSICASQAASGGCRRSPGWMIVHCCESCDPHLNSSRLIDPKERCGAEFLKTPPPIWKEGDLNRMFESWAGNRTLKEEYGLRVVSSPDPERDGASWEGAKEGSPWVVVFDDFLTDEEVRDLIRGGELEGYERSTDQGASNAVGEMEKVVSKTRTSSNAWCMHQCERLEGVRSATQKIEEITGIPRTNYESFQLLSYAPNQFYRSHHDSSRTDPSPPGPRILTFFLYLTDVAQGGETHFTKLGLSVRPKKGRALVWPSVLNDDPTYWDDRMFHEAKDVVEGKKLAANHWIHLNDYRTPNEWGCTGSFS